jgi:hypothetical protein
MYNNFWYWIPCFLILQIHKLHVFLFILMISKSFILWLLLRLPILTQSMVIFLKIIALIFLLFFNRPIVNVILFKSNLFEQVIKHLNQYFILWLCKVIQSSYIFHVLSELIREILTQVFNFGFYFLLFNFFIF